MRKDCGKRQDQPLEGLLVIDLTRLLPGPLCTMLLGDYGAEIIKIEDTEAGDPTRFVGPFIEGSGSFFRQLNRNKKSVALNLKEEQGREVIIKLAARADILVEGFRPGVMTRLGLDYDNLKKVNPRLVYASISGYGQQGPYRDRAGHDLNYTALSGLLDLSATGGEGPVMPHVQIADIAGGSLMALSGIMIALYRMKQTGEGSYVDVAMTRGLLPWLAYAASYLGTPEEIPRRNNGYITGAFACYNIYKTADGGRMSLGALEPVFWQRFCESVGKPQWVPLQFAQEGRAELIKAVGKIFLEKTRAEWERHFKNIDACCEPVLDLFEAAEHPISRAGDYWLEQTLEGGKQEKTAGFPLLFSGIQGERRLPPPSHGRHTEEILRSLGYQDQAIAAMARERVVLLAGK